MPSTVIVVQEAESMKCVLC